MKEKYQKVLGLDIGSNSIGYSFLKLYEKNGQIIFDEIASNSIIFSESNTAEERRLARSARRLHERKSTRNKNARKLFVEYAIADKDFISNTTLYLQSLSIDDNDVYRLREKAVLGNPLTKDEFILSTYSILTDRGYTNMFALVEEETDNKEQKKEDEKLNGAIKKNKDIYVANNYTLPSMVLTSQRKELEGSYQNVPIRNKKGNYNNSLDRDMHKEEFRKVVMSQMDNKDIFNSKENCESFISEILESKYNSFYQRPLKSFEGMVEYCSFYDEFNPTGSEKRMPLANVANVELTLRQNLDNYETVNKNGEIKKFTKDEKDKVVEFWLNNPNADKITNKNMYKNAGFKEYKIHIKDDKELLILNIQAYRAMLEILKKYDIDFKEKDNVFYNEVLLVLYYYKNYSSRIEYIAELMQKYYLKVDNTFLDKLAKLTHMDGFSSFSLKFANEVLISMKTENKLHSEALEALGYYDKYVDMPSYDYLPPLEPSKADIEWLQNNISYFDTKHLYYQPMMSPKVKRVISILRKLVNELIKKYGKIDEIRIETAKELNSKKEEDKIKKNQTEFNRKNSDAEKFLKANDIYTSNKNIERAKFFKEQECQCLYCGGSLTNDEAFDESLTEIEHFIPRSVIWINSQKNKILVHTKCNQNKGSQNPIAYLKSIHEWENFKGRIKLHNKHPKYKWLTDESVISSAMQKEYWQESYLNDTRAATRAVQKYLNHYLYPSETRHNKGVKRHISSVTGKAISELKYMWGIHTVMPKNSKDKKDRNTNYHHTLDAFSIALCSPSAIQALHNYFKKNENKFKTKSLKEKIANTIPVSKEGVNIVEHLKVLVEKYETNALYVCPYNKRKSNMKGFKDGNLKIYVAKDPQNETKVILAEMEKIQIDSSLLSKQVGLNIQRRSDDEVKKEIASIVQRLNPKKQQNIIDSIKTYTSALLDLRSKIDVIDNEIEKQKKKIKTGKQHKEFNDIIKEEIQPFQDESKSLSKQLQSLMCSFRVKNRKRQIVKSVKLHKVKISKTSADSIVFSNRDNRSIERLTIENFEKALEDKEPFVIKENKTTLNINIYSDKKQGQLIGLNYFSSIANDILPKCKKVLTSDNKLKMKIYKNDILGIYDKENILQEIYTSNGGGSITNSSNILKINKINTNSKVIIPLGINKDRKVKKLKIDFFGNITEDKQDEN